MERVKRKKSMFPCLFGGNEESFKRRNVESWSPGDASSEQVLFKFEVGMNISIHPKVKRMKKMLAKGVSSARSILKKQGGLSDTAIIKPSNSVRHTAYHKGQEEEEETSTYHDSFAHQGHRDEMLNHSSHSIHHSHKSSRTKLERKEASNSDIPPKRIVVLTPNPENSKSVDHSSDYCRIDTECLSMSRSDSASESEVITGPSKITFNQNDRLTFSLTNTSAPSLISEATNRLLERWEMTQTQEDVEMVSKGGTLGEMLSFPDEEMRPAELDSVVGLVGFNDEFASPAGLDMPLDHRMRVSHEADADEKVVIYSEPLHQEPLTETSEGMASIQFSGPELEYSESLKMVDHHSQFSVLEAPPTEDLPYNSDRWETINYQIRELKKQLSVLKIKSKPTFRGLKLSPNGGQRSGVAAPESPTWEYSLLAHLLQAFDISYHTEPAATSTTPWQAIHHPTDPRLFYRLENYYYGGARLSRSEKYLFHSYIETTFVRTSKSMVAASSWVSPEKREDQLTLKKFSIDDQMRKVVDEIDQTDEIVKEDDEIWWGSYFDKDLEWLQPTDEIDTLGNLIAELVLNDLVLEVII